LKLLKTMIEAVGNLVVINGKYVVIDHTDKEDDGKRIATVVNIFSTKDDRLREREIHTMVESFCFGGGGSLTAGETQLSFSDIWRDNPGNDPMLKKHKELRKRVIVKNKETKEFFLVMDEKTSIATAENFIQKVNDMESPLLRVAGTPPGYKNLRFPCETMLGELGVDGNPKFEVVTNGRIVVIKLWAD
jgi:hypothetical protein